MKESRVLGKRILVADDEPLVREALRQLLSLDQHVITDVSDGAKALAAYRPGAFDLVITDYTMPEMNGSELAARIRQQSPKQPILMITAFSSELGSINHAADLVLKKPFTLDGLRQAIAQLLA